MSTDAIVILRNDHKEIRKLFRQFQQAGEDATEAKGRIVKRIIEELTVHTYLENECMYPRSAGSCRTSRTTSSSPTRSTTSPTCSPRSCSPWTPAMSASTPRPP